MEQLEPEVKFAIHALETENNKLDAESHMVLKERDIHVRNFQLQFQPTTKDSEEITHSLEGKFNELISFSRFSPTHFQLQDSNRILNCTAINC